MQVVAQAGLVLLALLALAAVLSLSSALAVAPNTTRNLYAAATTKWNGGFSNPDGVSERLSVSLYFAFFDLMRQKIAAVIFLPPFSLSVVELLRSMMAFISSMLP